MVTKLTKTKDTQIKTNSVVDFDFEAGVLMLFMADGDELTGDGSFPDEVDFHGDRCFCNDGEVQSHDDDGGFCTELVGVRPCCDS